MYDEPQSWQDLQTVCEIVRRNGGVATVRTGAHVHVGVGDYDHRVENHSNLVGVYRQNEDNLYRLAQNPEARQHRGTRWCSPSSVPARGFRDIHHATSMYSDHNTALNFGAVRGGRGDHVEFRMYDGSLDPGTIQAQVKTSLAVTQVAFESSENEVNKPAEPKGTHRDQNPTYSRLSGEAWDNSTKSFRKMCDRFFSRNEDKAQVTALFAVTRWQRRG